jgi:protein-tyrosine phosphatase
MELLLGDELKKAGITGLTVSSAGTLSVVDAPPHPEVLAELERRGIEPAPFKSRQLTAELAERPGLILTATRDQRNHIGMLVPRQRGATFTLRQFDRLASGVPGQEIDLEPDLPATLATLARRNRGLVARGTDDDIDDPMGGARGGFKAAFASIDPPLSRLAAMLLTLADRLQ